MNQSTIKTRSGIGNTDDVLQYKISTKDVEEYLWKKLLKLKTAMQNNGMQMNITRDQVNIKAMRVGKRFMPMLLIFPPEVFEKGTYNPNVSSMFQNDEDEAGGARLQQMYWKMLEPWLYKKEDKNSFRERQLQRALGITHRDDITQFTSLMYPRRHTDRDSRGNQVTVSMVVVLDPVRVFRDMLTLPDYPNQRFRCNVEDFHMLDDDAAMYHISREVVHRRKERYSRNINQIIKKMNERNGRR